MDQNLKDYIKATANLYGVIHKSKFLEIYNSQNKEQISAEDFPPHEYMLYNCFASIQGDHLVRVSIIQETLRPTLIEAAKESFRDRAIIELLAATGLRSGELLNIKLEDIDWESRQIEIKSRARRRVVYVTRSCASVLKEYLATKNGDSPYLFSGKGSGPMSYFCLHRVFRKYSDLLKLGYNITPQTLRYTMAVQVFKKGMPLSIINEMMGYTTNPNNNVLNNALSNICAGYFK